MCWTPKCPPSCFGTRPSYQERAENDCHTCSWAYKCFDEEVAKRTLKFFGRTYIEAKN